MAPTTHDIRPAARLTAFALIAWAVIAGLHTILAIGSYEEDIAGVTHSSVDVWPAWLLYRLLDGPLRYGMLETVADWTWIAASLIAVVALVIFLYLARREARRQGSAPVWASLVATVFAYGLIWLYDITTARGGALKGTALDTRLVAYPLWIAGTVLVVITVICGARLVRRITVARQHAAEETPGG